MAFLRFVAIALICAAATLADVRSSFAQGLSDASLVIGTNWSGGYMALGGHLGKAIAKQQAYARTRAKPTVSRQRPRVRKPQKVVAVAYRRDVTASYLVAESLDQTGLNIAGLRFRSQEP
ncbi:hypothetical protein [Hyphomicrobium sp.]|uniref:hypothetical protein n=1 Tax=Hyphomicrobium sp. TaxID=82 RepID=UPI001D81076D|nr:hypothetical protein [Hyphomicrobium sp.]MBY0561977.1 hypothetical protein [Hyphomicrobium sp.]